MPDALTLALAQIDPTVGDINGNVELIRAARAEAAQSGAELVVFPELCILGYPAEDLVFMHALQHRCLDAVRALAGDTADGGPAMVVGLPWLAEDGRLYNSAALLDAGDLAGVVAKCELPNYGVFDEKRIFTPAFDPKPIAWRRFSLGLMVCEDLWFPATPRALAEQGAEILIAPHASPFRETGLEERRAVAQGRAQETGLASVVSNQLGGQDQLIFDGGGFVVDGTGEVVVQTPLFERTVQTVTFERRAPGEGRGLTVRQPMMAEVDGGADRVYRALIMGLRDYVHKSGFSDVLLGLSGGIDSALVAVLAVDAFGPAHVKAFKLPSRYTSRESREDAETLAKSLGIELGELPIAEITDTAERVLDQEVAGQSGEGLAWENLQSRVRGALLMTVSNAQGALLLTTGNKSEVAVGYTTLYGDMCGAMNPLKDVYKTRVYAMALRRNHWKPTEALGPDGPLIPDSILTKAPTAELKPDQKDTDSLPAYEDLDPILECLVERAMSVDEIAGKGFDHALVARVENLLHGAEYKRRQAAPGLKVTNMAFGLDRRYPIVNAFRSGGGSA